MPEVVTLGECMAVVYPCDSVAPEQATTLTLGIGGAEANLAIGLSQLGHHVKFISRVGNDPFGRRIRATLDAETVDTTDLITDITAPTGVFFREWLPDGECRGFYYRSGSAASRLAPEDLYPGVFKGARLLHITGITPALSPNCAAAITRAIDLAHAAGIVISFNPNYRSALWNQEIARETLLPVMARSDILLMGHEDCQAILSIDGEGRVLLCGRDMGARIVVLKRAEHGACALMGSEYIAVPAEVAEAVIDPVGAGDAFNAGFLAGWLRGISLEDSLCLGARLGAATVATLGDYIPAL